MLFGICQDNILLAIYNFTHLLINHPHNLINDDFYNRYTKLLLPAVTYYYSFTTKEHIYSHIH